LIIHTNLHTFLHDIYRHVVFLIRLPYHVIFHHQEYGHTVRGFILCDEPCGYCYDGGYACMNCHRCYDNSKWIRLFVI